MKKSAEKQKEKPAFYAILPADVRYDEKLCANAKLVFAEITALAQKEGYCFASNSYFAELYGVSVRTVSTWIGQLIKRGYLLCEIDQKAGNQRRLHLLTKISIGVLKKTSIGQEEKFAGAIEENFYHNNTRDNKKREDTPEGRARIAYEHAKSRCENLPPLFFDFFEKEILGWWDKYVVTPAALEQWHRAFWQEFDETVRLEALTLHRSASDNWQPRFASLASTARQIVTDKKQVEKTKTKKLAEEAHAEDAANCRGVRDVYEQKTAEELLELYETRPFDRQAIDRHCPDLIKKAKQKSERIEK